LCHASDGTMVSLAEDLMRLAAGIGWPGPADDYFKVVEDRECLRLLGKRRRCEMSEIMAAVISFRNDGVEGHGLPNDSDTEKIVGLLDAVSLLIERVGPYLP